jgi:hypothetical protein
MDERAYLITQFIHPEDRAHARYLTIEELRRFWKNMYRAHRVLYLTKQQRQDLLEEGAKE